jgi:predicted transcriptional regulator
MPALFPISIEVDEAALGRVLRKLNTMEGIVRLHLNLGPERGVDSPVLLPSPAKPDPEPVVDASTSPALKYRTDGRLNSRATPISDNPAYRVIAEMLHNARAHNKVLAEGLRVLGITNPNAIHGYVNRMSAMNLIKRTAPGTYSLTEKGERTFFVPSKKAAPSKATSMGRTVYKQTDNRSGVRYLILSSLGAVNSMSGTELTKIITSSGFSAKNISTTGMKMRHEGLMVRRNERYSITSVGRAAIAGGQHHVENGTEDERNPT